MSVGCTLSMGLLLRSRRLLRFVHGRCSGLGRSFRRLALNTSIRRLRYLFHARSRNRHDLCGLGLAHLLLDFSGSLLALCGRRIGLCLLGLCSSFLRIRGS